jgi:hypothetical protein
LFNFGAPQICYSAVAWHAVRVRENRILKLGLAEHVLLRRLAAGHQRFGARMRTFVIEGTVTSEQPLATCSKDLHDLEGVDQKPTPVPSTTIGKGRRLMFPGSGLRATLRRAARDVVRKRVISLTGNAKPFSLDQHYFLTLGGIKGAGKQERGGVAMMAACRAANPLISMFGAGDAGVLGFVDGNLSIGNAICKEYCEAVIFSGARTDDLYRDKSQIAFLSDADLDTLVRRAKGGKVRSELAAQMKMLEKEAKKALRAGTAEQELALRGKLAELEARLKTVKEESGSGDVAIGMPLAGWQAIPQGQEMDHRMILKRSSQVELGLLLAALDEFARFPVIGAHYATGCGLVSAEWEFFEVGEDGRRSIGRAGFEPFGKLEIDTGKLYEARQAFEQFMLSKAWDFSIPAIPVAA